MSRKYAFLNTTIILFCLIYSLNIHHSNKKVLFFHPDRSFSISYQYIRRPCCNMWWDSHGNKFGISFSDHCHGTWACVWFWWQIQSTYFVYCFQSLNQNSFEYPRFTNCYGKSNSKSMPWHSETWLDTHCLIMNQ